MDNAKRRNHRTPKQHNRRRMGGIKNPIQQALETISHKNTRKKKRTEHQYGQKRRKMEHRRRMWGGNATTLGRKKPNTKEANENGPNNPKATAKR